MKGQTILLAGITMYLLTGCGGGEFPDFTDELNTMREELTSEEREVFAGRPVVFYNVENLFDTENDPHTDDDDFTPFGYKSWDDDRYEDKLERIEDVMTSFDEMPILVGLA